MPTDLGEGTLVFDVAPPQPWPPAEEVLIDTSFHTKDVEAAIRALPSGRLKITLIATGQPAVVIHTCPVTFTGTGYFRLAIAHKNESVVVFGGGECLASYNDDSAPVADATIVLKRIEELAPVPDDDPPEWTAEPGRTGHKY